MSINLPVPDIKDGMTLTEAINRRRSIRKFGSETLSQSQLAQLLWAAQGITERNRKLRAAPSPGGTYPVELYAVCGDNCVEGLNSGVYRYDTAKHALELHLEGDLRVEVVKAGLNQESVSQAPVIIVLCAEYERTQMIYGTRVQRYVHMEAGHIAQNIYLQATALGLATASIGAFQEEQVKTVLQLFKRFVPLYIMPVGKPG